MGKIGLDLSGLSAKIVADLYRKLKGKDAPMKAWVKQLTSRVRKHGADNASWYVEWNTPDGQRKIKSFGPGIDGLNAAKKKAQQITNDLNSGTYGLHFDGTWEEFLADYKAKILSGRAIKTRVQAEMSLANFKRLAKPTVVSRITSETIAGFTAKRRAEKNKYRNTVLSPASVNADLRNIKAALKIAVEWSYLKEVPRFHFEREPQRMPRFVTPEDFDSLYAHVEAATLPRLGRVKWWQAFFAFAYLTGWRLGEILSLSRADVDLVSGHAIIRAEKSKGRREELIPLHPVVVAHLKQLKGFTKNILHWPHDRRTIYVQFGKIQKTAGLKTHYSFHDLRRAFGTLNAPGMQPRILQMLMRHKDLQTTQKFYINPQPQIATAIASLKLPAALAR